MVRRRYWVESSGLAWFAATVWILQKGCTGCYLSVLPAIFLEMTLLCWGAGTTLPLQAQKHYAHSLGSGLGFGGPAVLHTLVLLTIYEVMMVVSAALQYVHLW